MLNSIFPRGMKKSKAGGILLTGVVVVLVTAGFYPAAAGGRMPMGDVPVLTRDEHGYLQVPFEFLGSYDYTMPSDEEIEQKKFPDQIPAYIKMLDGEKIVIEGFMMPSEYEDKRLKKLVLFNTYLGCCFGTLPRMNEWIYAEMKTAQNSEFVHGMAIKVYGTLEVGENIDWDGGLSLYRMKGDKIEVPYKKKEWWEFGK